VLVGVNTRFSPTFVGCENPYQLVIVCQFYKPLVTPRNDEGIVRFVVSDSVHMKPVDLIIHQVVAVNIDDLPQVPLVDDLA